MTGNWICTYICHILNISREIYVEDSFRDLLSTYRKPILTTFIQAIIFSTEEGWVRVYGKKNQRACDEITVLNDL